MQYDGAREEPPLGKQNPWHRLSIACTSQGRSEDLAPSKGVMGWVALLAKQGHPECQWALKSHGTVSLEVVMTLD